jgi:CHAT domain-containing protein
LLVKKNSHRFVADFCIQTSLMKNKLLKNVLCFMILVPSITTFAQTDVAAAQWQQFIMAFDTIPVSVGSSIYLSTSEKLMAFAEKNYPKEHSNYIISLYHYGTGLLLNKQFSKVDSLFPTGWAWIQNHPKDTLAFAQWYTLKGNLFQLKKDYKTAVKVNQQAIEHLEPTQNPKLFTYLCDFYISNASMCQSSDRTTSVALAQKALNFAGSRKPLSARALEITILLTQNQQKLGNYKQAIEVVEQNLPFCADSVAYYKLFKHLAHIYTDMHLSNKGVDCWKQVCNYYASIGNKKLYSGALDNYAYSLGSSGRFEEAYLAASEAVPLLAAYWGKEHNLYRSGLSHVAMYAAELKKWDIVQEIIPILEAILAKSASETTESIEFWRGNLSAVYEKMGNLPKAIEHKTKSVQMLPQLYGKGESHSLIGQRVLLKLNLLDKRFEDGIHLAQDILSANNEKVVHQFEFLSEQDKEIYLKNYLAQSFRLVLETLQKYGRADAKTQQLLYDALLATRGVVLRGTKQLQESAAKNPDTSVQRLYQERVSLKKQLGALYSTSDSEKWTQKAGLEQQLNQIEQQLVLKLPELQKSFQNITHSMVQKALPKQGIAIEFMDYRYVNSDTTFYAALILKPNQAFPELVFLFEERDLKKILGNATKITDLYANRGSQNVQNASLNGDVPAHALYDLIWKPLLPHLNSGQPIYYTPSGLLNQVALDALMVNDSTFLSDVHPLYRCLSTGELLFEAAEPTFAIQSALLYGGIQYDADAIADISPTRGYHETEHEPQTEAFQQILQERGTTNHAWSYLKGTQKEIEILSQLFQKQHIPVQALNQQAASEAHFKRLGQQTAVPTILHLATHGFSFPAPKQQDPLKTAFQTAEHPLIRSGLVLAGANQAWTGKQNPNLQEDGILTAYEISNMQLTNIQLVVLSACETGLGDVRGTEGVYGLQRAFKMAGVSYLVVSLWQIPDEQTTVFMAHFYENLLNKQPIRQAFTQAQNLMKLKYPPYYWAGLVLVR